MAKIEVKEGGGGERSKDSSNDVEKRRMRGNNKKMNKLSMDATGCLTRS
jgi:hypothetical protein